MNVIDYDILKIIIEKPFLNQRKLAADSGFSLGTVNQSVKRLYQNGYINYDKSITSKALQEINKNKPHKAIILAAGYGMRMIPINTLCPKGLLMVKGELLIERIIRQLHEVNVRDITIVVGFMKEKFEYLIDEYGVKLVVNPCYSTKNNIYSLSLVKEDISNAYIIPSDIWCKKNPFNDVEMYSWYMISDTKDYESNVRINRKNELVTISNLDAGNKMIGIAYLLEKEASLLKNNLIKMTEDKLNDNEFWEKILYRQNKMVIPGKLISRENVIEINTYEQLRELDENANQLNVKADVICPIVDGVACP